MNVIAQTNFDASRMIYLDYDNYLTAKKATASYLQLEEDIILNEVKQLPDMTRQLGIDLGCGTGRISLLINSYFQKLLSFDISEEMLSIAKSKHYSKAPKFILHDFNQGIEYFLSSTQKAGLVCASFGVGSCIENLDNFLTRIVKILSKDGLLILSFYNKNYTAITTDSNELPFSSMLNAKDNMILVDHQSTQMQIKINSYNRHDLQKIINKYAFKRSQFYFLPTLSGLIKSNLLHDPDFQEKVIAIDRSLMNYENTVSAPYILLVLSV